MESKLLVAEKLRSNRSRLAQKSDVMDDGLKCPVEGCKKVIHGMTGFDELQKLSAHMKRVHGRGDGFNVFDAMTFRDMSENNVKTKEGLLV